MPNPNDPRRHEPPHQEQHHDQPHEHETQPKPPASATSADPKGLTSPKGEPTVVRFTINGQVKSLSKPVTGADLHRVAGSPKAVKLAGKDVPDSVEPVEIPDDAEIKVEY